MKTSVLIITAALGLYSCSPRIYPVQRDTVTVTRTERVVEYRDTTLNVPVPEGSASSSGQIRDTTDILETGIAVSGVEIKDDIFHHWLRNKSEGFLVYQVKLPEVTVTTEKDNRIFVRDIQVVEKQLTGWQKTVMAAGFMMFACILMYIAFKIVKWKRML